jgi:predicted PurR-regulated permease PerM
MNHATVTITPWSVITVMLFGVLLALLWYLRDLVLIVLTAVVIASAMEPAVRFLMRHRIPRTLGVIVLYLLFVLAFVGGLVFFVPPVLSDAAGFLSNLPETLANLNLAETAGGLLPWVNIEGATSPADVLHELSATLTQTGGGIIAALAAIFGGIASLVLILVFAFYFSVQETGVDDFLRIVTPSAHQAYVLDLWKRSQQKIGKWMQGQLILVIIVGVLVYLGLTILGVPYALLLAVLAGMFELIPVFGPILAAVPAVVVAFVDGGASLMLLTVGLYLLVQQFESNLIYPVVVKKVVGVPALLVILALLIGYELAGFLGVLLSVPIAGAIQELVTDIDKRKSRLQAGGEA